MNLHVAPDKTFPTYQGGSSMFEALKKQFPSATASETIQVDSGDPDAAAKITSALQNYFSEISVAIRQPIVILCIGSDRSTGDALGPLTGSKLAEVNLSNVHVFGTIDNPVHAGNLSEILEEIRLLYSNPIVIAIDACLGRLDSVGKIQLGKGSLKPGAGVKKDLPPVGDLHITGIVNVGGFMEYLVLQNTRLSTVMKLANLISSGLINYFLQERTSPFLQ